MNPSFLFKNKHRYFTLFEKKLSLRLVPELKKKKNKIHLNENPYFLKNGFVADASFLTNYQKISKFIKEHENFNGSQEFPDKKPFQNDQFHEKKTEEFHEKIHEKTPLNPFELHLTNKNLSDVHANSKHFFPLYKDMQFTDFGEMNKEKCNATSFVIQQNWPNFQGKLLKESQGIGEYVMEKNSYPNFIMKNEGLTEFLRAEQRLKETQNDRLKMHIEALGGIEDTISSKIQ